MISINLYQPQKFNYDIDIPSAWNDLEERELHYIASVLLTSQEETANQTRPRVFKFILENRVKKAKINLPVNFFQLLDIESIALQALSIFDFIFNTSNLTRLPAPIRLSMRKYCPVSFDEITCGEYEDCEVILNDFEEDPSSDHLARLTAIIFRPAGVPYMKFRAASNSYATYKSAQKEKYFKKLKPEHLYSILIWYAGCRSMLPQFFSELYRGGKSNKKDPKVFTNTIHAGAGPKNGTRDQIRCTKLYEFLYDCNQEAIKARELQEELDRINRK